jgi:hypothetical protein
MAVPAPDVSIDLGSHIKILKMNGAGVCRRSESRKHLLPDER